MSPTTAHPFLISKSHFQNPEKWPDSWPLPQWPLQSLSSVSATMRQQPISMRLWTQWKQAISYM